MSEKENAQVVEDATNKQIFSKSIAINIETIFMTGLIFSGLVIWFEFFEILYSNLFPTNGNTRNLSAVLNKLWFCLFVTVLIITLLYIVYKIQLKRN